MDGDRHLDGPIGADSQEVDVLDLFRRRVALHVPNHRLLTLSFHHDVEDLRVKGLQLHGLGKLVAVQGERDRVHVAPVNDAGHFVR